MGRERSRKGKHLCVLIAFAAIVLMVVGCAPVFRGGCLDQPTSSWLREGEANLTEGHYEKALRSYKQALEKSPEVADQALFFIGVIYASPKYDDGNYQKALDTFQKIAKEYPESCHRQEADRMAVLLREIIGREKKNSVLKTQCENLKTQVEALETQIKQMKAVDLDIEGKRRRIEIGK